MNSTKYLNNSNVSSQCKSNEQKGMNNVMEATPMYHSNANKSSEPTEPIQEAIYDFGGANVKSCASIALSKSISKGLVPPGTKLPQQQWASSSKMHQNFINPSMI